MREDRNRMMNLLLCSLCALSAESGGGDPVATAWGKQAPVSVEGCCKCCSFFCPQATITLSLRGGGLDLGGYERPKITLQKHCDPLSLVPQRPSSKTTGAKAGSGASASSGISQHAHSPIAPAKAHGIPASFLSEMGGSWYAGDAAENGETLKGCGNHEEERTHSDDLVVDQDRDRGGGVPPPPPPPGGGGGGGEFVEGGIGDGIEEEKEGGNEEGEGMEDEEAGVSSGGGIGYDVQRDVLQEEERETNRMDAVVEEIERCSPWITMPLCHIKSCAPCSAIFFMNKPCCFNLWMRFCAGR